MDLNQRLDEVLEGSNVTVNPTRQELIRAVVERREAIVSATGALATWTPPESTGRSPSDTLIVRRAVSQETIDWDSPNNIPAAMLGVKDGPAEKTVVLSPSLPGFEQAVAAGSWGNLRWFRRWRVAWVC